MSTIGAARGVSARRSRLVGIANRPEASVVVGTILVWLVFVYLAGGRGFLTRDGTLGYLEIAAQIGIISSVLSLLMIAGEFDLSVGSMVGAASVIVAVGVGQFGSPVWLAVAAAFAFSLLVGWINGYLVVRTQLPSFVITLGALFVLRGAAIALTRLTTGRTLVAGLGPATQGDPFSAVFGGEVAGIQVSILWWLGLTALGSWILFRTPFGNWVLACGGSARLARNVGVPVARVKVTLFMATSAAAALLGVIQTIQFGSADVLRGTGKEFEAIITASVGGTLLSGGYGSVVGTLFGAITLGMIQLGILFAGIDADWYQVVLGGLLVGAVLVNEYVRRRATEARR